MWPVKLRPGVTVEQFERFLKEDWVEVFSSTPGMSSYVLKGIDGAEVGHYLLVVEFDRVETRDLYVPPSGETELYKQVSAKGMSAPESVRAEERWASLVVPEWVEGGTAWELVAQ
jgi:hypothetical protein